MLITAMGIISVMAVYSITTLDKPANDKHMLKVLPENNIHKITPKISPINAVIKNLTANCNLSIFEVKPNPL